MPALACFHCAEPVPAGEDRWLEIDGEQKAFCCAGCEAVTRLILEAGMDEFYRFRTQPAPKVGDIDAARWQGFNEVAVLDAYTSMEADGTGELRLQLDNVRCAACGWLVEQTLQDKPGVCDIRLNPVTGRASLRWRQDEVPLSELLAALDGLGFKPHPLRADENVSRNDGERRSLLKRLAVAGLGMMQVMMYAVAMYIGAFEDMDPAIQQFLRYVSLLIATPVVLYAAQPFFRAAFRDLRARRAGMDVPVSLAVGGAYAASVWHTFAGQGEVYFDSVSMFVFFLLIGRFAELAARHEVAESGNALTATLPATAERIDANGNATGIPLTMLKPGDRVRVTKGSAIPADGILVDTDAELDEALLTGESRAVLRRAGENIMAGAINRGAPFVMRVSRVGRETLLSGITRLLEQAQGARPRLVRFADRIARWFVGGVLLAAAITAFAWWQLDPAHAFEITLSVLVVTCPCALALAVPVALTAATGSLAQRGLLTVNSDALESLAGITDVVFDKTGTLTLGEPRLGEVTLAGRLPEAECLALAAGLEAQANHPIARAFRHSSGDAKIFSGVEQHAGHGISGMHDGRRYRIGTPSFAFADATVPEDAIVLADEQGVLATFRLEDSVRSEAHANLQALRDAGLHVHLFSGDSRAAVESLARRLDIENAQWRLAPEDKLKRVRALQTEGRRVLMIGDGINDAPVLAGADVSVAMADGAALAQSSADFVLTGALDALPAAIGQAARARRVMKQNLSWALAYNALALPLAATGFVAPWMAAIGMSASSLLVTLNALRLKSATKADTGEKAALVGGIAESTR